MYFYYNSNGSHGFKTKNLLYEINLIEIYKFKK